MRTKHAQPKQAIIQQATDPNTGRNAICSTWEPKTPNQTYFTLQINHTTLPTDEITRGSSPAALADMIHALVSWHNRLAPNQRITLHNPTTSSTPLPKTSFRPTSHP